MSTATSTILIVEDNTATRTFLADNLAADGYEPLEANSALQARELISSEFPDLAIVDLGLPDVDGLELIRELRAEAGSSEPVDADLPVLVLTGRSGELDQLRAFERGADDYLVKPFSYAQLRARLEAVLRRSQRRSPLARIRVGPLLIQPLSRQVWLHGEPVALSKKEFALLSALASEPTRVYTREELLHGVWGFRVICATRTVDSHASRLRKKLAAFGDRFVVNVWGVGYRLVDGPID